MTRNEINEVIKKKQDKLDKLKQKKDDFYTLGRIKTSKDFLTIGIIYDDDDNEVIEIDDDETKNKTAVFSAVFGVQITTLK